VTPPTLLVKAALAAVLVSKNWVLPLLLFVMVALPAVLALEN
jgi:hypothetical protein